MKLFVFVTLISLTRALLKSEIEVIRKELNAELTQLEEGSTNKSEENEEAYVNENDPTTDILMGNHLVGNSSKDIDILWQKVVDQRKVTENKDLAKLFVDDNTKKSFSTPPDNSLDALLEILLTEDLSSKRSVGDEDVCKDKNANCPNYKQQCNDKVYKSYFREKCPVTCDVCDPCKNNKWSQKKCDEIANLKLCQVSQFKDRLKENCYKSCGYCRAPSPPACMMHPLGCCWDGITFVKDGCKPCVDSSNVGRLCKSLKAECNNKYSPGKWMKKNCPVSCNFCDPEKDCHDYPQFKEQCFLWKILGKCSDDLSAQTCLKTCNACKKKLQ